MDIVYLTLFWCVLDVSKVIYPMMQQRLFQGSTWSSGKTHTPKMLCSVSQIYFYCLTFLFEQGA